MFKHAFALFLLLVIIQKNFSQQHFSDSDLELIELVGKTMKDNHIDYAVIEPQVPERFVNMLLKQLDPEQVHLTTGDSIKISQLFNWSDFAMKSLFFRHKLDELRQIVNDGLLASEKSLLELPPLDFFENDVVRFSILEDIPLARNKYELANYWKQQIKLELLFRYHEDSILRNMTHPKINAYLNERSGDVIKSELCRIESLLNEERLSNFIVNACLNAYCQSFDPHSNYLSKEDEINFLNSLSSEYFGAGIAYILSGSQFKVAQVSPFSSASDYPEIREGDEITGIFLKGERVDLSCLSPEELDGYFYGQADRTLHIELRSVEDQQFRQFTLTKRSVKNNQNHTFSFLMKDSLTQVGYISFPSFYSSMSIDGRSSAEDMALILMEFRKLPIDGLIVDLRNNGGGSLEEAQDLIGYFTEYGPLFMAVQKENPEGILFKDAKKGSLTVGKVVFLVNSLSASASELLVASMQFYPNSIVVGSPTFGKATGQEIFPLNLTSSEDPQGAVIVTNLKTYCMDGTTFQGKGVIPDVILPSVYSKQWIGENLLSYPLKHKRLSKKFRPVEPRYEPIDSLQFRVNERSSLEAVTSMEHTLKRFLLETKSLSVHYDSFSNVIGDLSKQKFEMTNAFEIVPMEVNEAFIEESKQISNVKLEDPILAETFRILTDWVRLTKQQ